MIYISGALTGIDNQESIKAFYESIGLLCQELGLNAYVPHLHTDPVKHPHVTPDQVFTKDKNQVINSDLLIAYIGYPSFGVGMEIAYAETKNIPTILLYEKDKTVSRFPRGIPHKIAEIQFEDYEDALNQLRKVLLTHISIDKQYTFNSLN